MKLNCGKDSSPADLLVGIKKALIKDKFIEDAGNGRLNNYKLQDDITTEMFEEKLEAIKLVILDIKGLESNPALMDKTFLTKKGAAYDFNVDSHFLENVHTHLP